MTEETTSETEWLAGLGIVDVATGRAKASEGREIILSAIRGVMGAGTLFFEHLIFAGMATRVQSFHEAAVTTCDGGNPHATFTLIRSGAEQAAAIIYTIDNPEKAKALWDDPEGHGVKIGKITNHAERSGRVANFRTIYGILSRYAHPSASAHFAGVRVGEGRTIDWQSGPRFKDPRDQLIAYAWIFEIAQMSSLLLVEYATLTQLVERQRRADRADE